MKWSFKLGRILGIDVYIHFTFLLLLGFIGLSQALAGGGLPAAANSMIFFLCLFGCVLLHEYGHALAQRLPTPPRVPPAMGVPPVVADLHPSRNCAT